MKLARLARQIIRSTPDSHLTVDALYASLDFRGPRNSHLAIQKDYRGDREARRPSFLTGEEDIGGDVLVFDYCNHDGGMWFTEYGSLVAAEQFILGGAGVFNSFTDLVLVFDHLRLRHYRVTYYSSKKGRFVELDIFRRNLDDRPFQDAQVEWLELMN